MPLNHRQRKVPGSRRTGFTIALAVLLALVCLVWAGSRHFSLHPRVFLSQSLRIVAVPVMAKVYAKDQRAADVMTAGYWHGSSVARPPVGGAPFVYEAASVPYLKAFREHYRLADLVSGAPSEYEAILKLAGWVGTQFDHGTDRVVGGNNACSPVNLIEEGRAGSKYWCEIAARVMVHAAASLSLPARVVTASSNGYTWEHAVAEIWSNDFSKWFVVDTDFNYVYERNGVPLSAVELMQHGKEWKRAGELEIRAIAPPKPSIPAGDAIDLYRYVHVDMRNDWCSRTLRPGSPAGGDLATWWVATPEMGPLLVAKRRLEGVEQMNWQVNAVYVTAAHDVKSDKPGVIWAAYSPYFAYLERQAADGAWHVQEADLIELAAGERTVVLRVVTAGGWKGPVTTYEVSGAPG